MPRRTITIYAPALLVLFLGASAGTAPPAGEVSLELTPTAAVYDLNKVRHGAVQFWATVHNGSDREIILAHPWVCRSTDSPADCRETRSLDPASRRGKAEILLTVRRPHGKTVALRDGLRWFEPDQADHMTLSPGQSGRFHLGWFFENARAPAAWWDPELGMRLFTAKGKYRVTLLYRNLLPWATVRDPATGEGMIVPVWTGELRSNEVAVTVK